MLFKYKLQTIGFVLGAVLGWGYWYFVGCANGTCAITSNPVRSTLYGALMGILIAGIFKTENSKEEIK